MLSLRNKQKLLLWQCEIIVSFVCRRAPAHGANKAQLTSRSAQPERHFRKAFARALSNQSHRHETNVTAIFSSTKLRFINAYSWLGKKKKKKSMGLQVSAGLSTQGSAELVELLSAIQQEQS